MRSRVDGVEQRRELCVVHRFGPARLGGRKPLRRNARDELGDRRRHGPIRPGAADECGNLDRADHELGIDRSVGRDDVRGRRAESVEQRRSPRAGAPGSRGRRRRGRCRLSATEPDAISTRSKPAARRSGTSAARSAPMRTQNPHDGLQFTSTCRRPRVSFRGDRADRRGRRARTGDRGADRQRVRAGRAATGCGGSNATPSSSPARPSVRARSSTSSRTIAAVGAERVAELVDELRRATRSPSNADQMSAADRSSQCASKWREPSGAAATTSSSSSST